MTSVKGLNAFDNEAPTTIAHMFNGARALTSIEMPALKGDNLTSMASIFYNCDHLESIDISKVDTSNVTDINNAFYYCYLLPSIDISNNDFSKVTNASSMFRKCFHLTTIYAKLTTMDPSKMTTSDGYEFYECPLLVGGNGTVYSADHADKSYARIDTASTPGYFTEKSA